jgi:hypothetical protein
MYFFDSRKKFNFSCLTFIVVLLALVSTAFSQSESPTYPSDAAASFTVTNLNDSGTGSLRQAIADAGIVAGDDTINFVNGLSGTITLTSGELLISSNITITGTDPDALAVSGNNASRVFNIAADTNVSINNLTITGGLVSGSNMFGGGILNAGTLSLMNSKVSGNRAAAGSAGITAVGGGIYNTKNLLIVNSTVSSNSAGCVPSGFSSCGSGEGGSAGGIYSTGILTLTNSKITGNRSDGSTGSNTGASAYAGGIDAEGTINITNSAISGNVASGRLLSAAALLVMGRLI